MNWYRSTNLGRTWEPMPAPHQRSPLAVIAQHGLQPGEVYDDGVGNLYRYEQETAER